jgi:hypothetical protein
MSSLLTQVVRRQALMMVPRRHESAHFIAGPPVNKITNTVKRKKNQFSLSYSALINFRKN